MSIDSIKSIVCNEFGISENDLMLHSRKGNIPTARFVLAYFIREKTKMKIEVISMELGFSHHSQVVYSCKAVNNRLSERSFRKNIESIEKKISMLSFDYAI